MKVLFIQRNGLEESLGVASLAASLERAGHDTDLILLSHCRDLMSELEKMRPGLIGFSVITGAHAEITEVARSVKRYTGIPTVMGGPHATYYAKEISDDNSVDYICRGESEGALVELADRLSKEEDTTHIENIWSNTPGGWVKNELRPIIHDLDSLPMPKRDLYYKYRFLRDMPMKRFIAGMWCPHICTYCHNTMLMREYRGKGRFVRLKSVSRVIDEVLSVKKRSVLKRIHFSDDLFASDISWLREFSERFPEEAKIPFSCNLCLDCPPEAVELLARSGCVGVAFGFEAGSERIRKEYLKKFWTNEQARSTVELFRRHRIKTAANTMFALPGETLEDAFSSVEWNARIGFDFSRVGVFQPFPNLELTGIAKREGLLPADFSLKDFKPHTARPAFNKEHGDEIINIINLIYPAMKIPFFRKSMLRRLVKIRPNVLFDLVGGFSTMLQNYLFFDMRPLASWRYFRNAMGSVRVFFFSYWSNHERPVIRVYRREKLPESGRLEGRGPACWSISRQMTRRRRLNRFYERTILDAAGIRGRLLDIGCSYGNFVLYAREKGWEIAGVDIDRDAVKQIPDEVRSSIKVLDNGRLEEAAFKEDSFDVVTLWHVLEHISDSSGLLDAIKKILKTDGVLALQVPNGDSIEAGIFGPAWVHLDPPRHMHLFSPGTLIPLLKNKGFAVRRVSHFAPLDKSYRGSLARFLNRKTRIPEDSYLFNNILYKMLADAVFSPLSLLGSICGKGTFITVVCTNEK
ncbi:MAG: methyltransferase domain-containing protein [Candidatus Omnitrophota bacterium]